VEFRGKLFGTSNEVLITTSTTQKNLIPKNLSLLFPPTNIMSTSVADNEIKEPKSCANCGQEETDAKLKGCAACKLVKYCSKDCQVSHRSRHKRRARNELLSYMKRRCSGSRQGEMTVPFAFVCCPKLIREEVKHIGLVAGKLFAADVVMSTFKSLGKIQCVHFADIPPLNEFLNG
jgi:hypothetical protein